MRQISDDKREILLEGFSNLGYVINDSGSTEVFMVKQDSNNVTHLFWVSNKDVEYKYLKDLRYLNKQIPKKEMKILEEFFK